MTKCLKIFALLVFLQTWADAGRAAEPAGEVLAISGACSIESGGQRQALKRGDAVHQGDSVEVAVAAKLKLRMADGSVLSLAGGSHLTVAAYTAAEGRRDARLDLSSGLLHAVVATMAAPSRFEVDTATAVAAVRSTDWFIEAKPELSRVGVVEGVVALASKVTGASVDIPKGFGARVEKGKDPIPPRTWTAAEFEEYRQLTTLP